MNYRFRRFTRFDLARMAPAPWKELRGLCVFVLTVNGRLLGWRIERTERAMSNSKPLDSREQKIERIVAATHALARAEVRIFMSKHTSPKDAYAIEQVARAELRDALADVLRTVPL